MRVYIVRHGESENNRKGIWTGWVDAPLTEKGEADAEAAKAILQNVAFDKVYTSDLSRAMKTAEIAIPGCRYEATNLLREINVGNLANQPLSTLTDEQRARVPLEGYAFMDGETRTSFRERVLSFQKELESLDCRTVAAFSHGGFLREFLNEVVGMRLPSKHVCCNNCTIGIFEYANNVWRLHSWINL